MPTQNKHTHLTPWGRIVGLLTACLVTLVGVLSDLDPHVILLRAFAASAVIGCVIAVLVSICRPGRRRAR